MSGKVSIKWECYGMIQYGLGLFCSFYASNLSHSILSWKLMASMPLAFIQFVYHKRWRRARYRASVIDLSCLRTSLVHSIILGGQGSNPGIGMREMHAPIHLNIFAVCTYIDSLFTPYTKLSLYPWCPTALFTIEWHKPNDCTVG